MAKMRIFEIARSLQSKNKEIKSGTLVKLLNDNGFDVKGANSNIEDDAIAFLLKTFTNKDADVPAKKETKPKPGAAAAKTTTTGEESRRRSLAEARAKRLNRNRNQRSQKRRRRK